MRRLTGVLCMLLGLALLGGALALVLHNRQEDQMAQDLSMAVMPEIREQIRLTQETAPAETKAPEETVAALPAENLTDYVPAEFLNPEDLVMTEKNIGGYAYIGYLTIPELNLELPVMSGWDSRRLQIAPCRYTGTLRGEDLVLMAHNYGSHFGRLDTLTVGTQLQFTDMDGKVWPYEVAAMDVLAAEAVEEMTSGEYDLTLFTCTKNRTHRVTVRCNKAEDS